MSRASPPARPAHAKKAAKARWQTRGRAVHPKPSVVVVGFGRLGGALALGLSRARWPVTVLPRSGDSVRRAVQFNLKLADHDALRDAELCILAVPDRAVERLAASLADDLGPQTALVHCAGALDLLAFGGDPSMQRRPRGSFHPLCAVSDPRDELSGHSVAVAASTRELMPLLWRMALALRLQPLEVPDAQRAAYHAGAVLASGHLVALASAAVSAMEVAGIQAAAALEALLPLMQSALRGVSQRGLSRALTGPLVRGDLAVVEEHLAALPLELAELYRGLARRGLALVKDQLPNETRLAFERLLK